LIFNNEYNVLKDSNETPVGFCLAGVIPPLQGEVRWGWALLFTSNTDKVFTQRVRRGGWLIIETFLPHPLFISP